MKNTEYLDHYFGGIKNYMSVIDYKDLTEELKEFKKKNIDLPEVEFRRLVKDIYSDWILSMRMKFMLNFIDKINTKVQFFVILTVIWIIATIIVAISIVDKLQ